jgi:hypothetical protein
MNYIYNYDIWSLNEKLNLTSWQKLTNKIQKDLGLNLFFVSTFGIGISVFYPLVENILKKENIDISKPDIVLITLCSISILVNENKSSITKMKEIIKEKKLSEYLSKALKSIESTKNIIIKVLLKLGETVTVDSGLIDLFAYTNILVPSISLINKLITETNISTNDFINIGIGLGISVVSLAAKEFIKNLFNRIKNYIN